MNNPLSPSAAAKEERERAAFADFVHRSPSGANWIRWESRPSPEPDLLCQHRTNGLIAFELVEISDSRIAEILSIGSKASTIAIWTEDPTAKIITKKLKAKYVTTHPIILLVYTNGALISTDDMIKPTIIDLASTCSHPFHEIWLNGEESVELLWKQA